jgi:hypothetical protein
MDTVREITIYPATVTLTARDQYNDYSVVYDYHVEVNDHDNAYFRSWYVGTDRKRAMAAFNRAVAAVIKAQ